MGRQMKVFEVADFIDGDQVRAERTGCFPILALRDVELGMADPVANGAFVAEG